jgi:hypothetical protein
MPASDEILGPRVLFIAIRGGAIMRPHQTIGALGTLLQILEEGERLVAEEPTFPFEAKRKTANSSAPDQSANRLAERIASAMLRLRAQGGY